MVERDQYLQSADLIIFCRMGKRFYRLPTHLLIDRYSVGTNYVPTLLRLCGQARSPVDTGPQGMQCQGVSWMGFVAQVL